MLPEILLSSQHWGGYTSGLLCSVLVSQIEEGYGHTGKGPAKGQEYLLQ